MYKKFKYNKKGLDLRHILNTFAKYESPINDSKKVIDNV